MNGVKKESFVTQLQTQGRVLIPYHIRRVLGLETGDVIRVTVEKIKREADKNEL